MEEGVGSLEWEDNQTFAVEDVAFAEDHRAFAEEHRAFAKADEILQ